jgi:hypothetical protein
VHHSMSLTQLTATSDDWHLTTDAMDAGEQHTMSLSSTNATCRTARSPCCIMTAALRNAVVS